MALDSQDTGSLYDFLYLDRERIHSLTAQLVSSGVLTSLKHVDMDIDGSKESVSLNIGVFKGSVEGNDTVRNGLEKLFDTSWSTPLALLDHLDEANKIKRGLTDATALGDIVLINGGIKIFDISMVSNILPFAKRFIPKGNKKDKFDLDVAVDIFKFIPKSTQIDFGDESGSSGWMSVDPDNLTIASGDIALKYGSNMPGEWFVLGVIDALPDTHIHNKNPYNIIVNDMKGGLNSLLDMLRENIGRPSFSYGITPLMIFRPVGD